MWINIEDAIEVIKDDKQYKAITIGNIQDYYTGEQLKKSYFAFDKVFIDLNLQKNIDEIKAGFDKMENTLRELKRHEYLTKNN